MTMEKQWEDFARQVLPNAPEKSPQYRALRKAFVGGYAAALQQIQAYAELPEDDAHLSISRLHCEVRMACASYGNGRN